MAPAPREIVERIAAEHMMRARPPLCPEIETREGGSMLALWEALESACEAPQDSPYWAWSWPGGQALARYLLDHPATVRGRRVLDLGAGNGLAAVSARLAGARRVLANDVEPLACAMAALTARLNGVEVECASADLLGSDPADGGFDVILVGDLFYAAELARRAERWLRRARESGTQVLIGEPGRGFALRRGGVELACYAVEVRRELESATRMEVRVLKMK